MAREVDGVVWVLSNHGLECADDSILHIVPSAVETAVHFTSTAKSNGFETEIKTM